MLSSFSYAPVIIIFSTIKLKVSSNYTDFQTIITDIIFNTLQFDLIHDYSHY